VRSVTVRALASRRDSTATQALFPLLRDSDPFVRSATVTALAVREDPIATQAKLLLLRDNEPFVRSAAIRSLAGHQEPTITHALLPLLRDTHPDVRFIAAWALAGTQDRAITQALFRFLRDNDNYLHGEAADLLARQTDPQVLTWITKRSARAIQTKQRKELYVLADKIADRSYLLLHPASSRQILKRLGWLTRRVAPIPKPRRSASRRGSHLAAMAVAPERWPVVAWDLSGRRIAAAATAAGVAVLAVVLMAMRWNAASKVAVIVSALAAVAAVGVAIWAALPAMSDRS
jgi:hypothetical protein